MVPDEVQPFAQVLDGRAILGGGTGTRHGQGDERRGTDQEDHALGDEGSADAPDRDREPAEGGPR